MPDNIKLKRHLRKQRVRTRLAMRNKGQRARLSLFRSSRHIYVQIIDDAKGHTLACASSRDEEFKGEKGSNKEAARQVGLLIAQRAKKAGVQEVVFDRGHYIHHGRIQVLAEAAREGGLQF